MAKRKSKPNIKEYRRDLAKLKRAGLVSPKIDARSHKPTRYMLNQLKEFKEVIDGRAKAIKTPSREVAREFSNVKKTKFDRVVMYVGKEDHARYDKSSGTIKVNRKSYYPDVDRYTQILTPQDADELPTLPNDTFDKVYRYGIPFMRGHNTRRLFADTVPELIRLMWDYDPKNGGRFKDWQSYIEVLEFDRSDIPEDEFEIERDFEDEDAGRASYERRRKAKAQPRDESGRFVKAGRNSASKKTRKKTKGKARAK